MDVLADGNGQGGEAVVFSIVYLFHGGRNQRPPPSFCVLKFCEMLLSQNYKITYFDLHFMTLQQCMIYKTPAFSVLKKRFHMSIHQQRGLCILFFCRLYPSSPQPPWQCLAPILPFISLLIANTVPPIRRCGLAYPYDWRGFMGAKKKTSVGLLVFNTPWRTLYNKPFSFCIAMIFNSVPGFLLIL